MLAGNGGAFSETMTLWSLLRGRPLVVRLSSDLQADKRLKKVRVRYSLVDAEPEGDFRPESGVLHRLHLLLGVSVNVHVEH